VSFSFPVLASSGIDAKVGSLGLVEEMLPLRERQHVQGRLLICDAAQELLGLRVLQHFKTAFGGPVDAVLIRGRCRR
jgi:hypothetical protein